MKQVKQLNTLKELKEFMSTAEAFQGEFQYKGFGIWWWDYEAIGIQSNEIGYFRCDPSTKSQYDAFYKLQDSQPLGYNFELS